MCASQMVPKATQERGIIFIVLYFGYDSTFALYMIDIDGRVGYSSSKEKKVAKAFFLDPIMG